VPEPYRTALILRDLEEMSYEEVAEVLAISLGTVKSRITRGRDALRKKLTGYVREVGPELGLLVPAERPGDDRTNDDRTNDDRLDADRPDDQRKQRDRAFARWQRG